MDNYIDYIKENGFIESEWESLTPIEKARYVRKTNEKYGIKTSPIDKFISNPTIRKAVVNDRFEIAHSDKYDYIYTIPFESGSVNVPVKVKDGIIDMPLVKDELIMILEHVLTVDSLKDYKIHFKSGTRVNDIEGAWKSTGYSMILESNTSGAKALETVLNEYKEITNIIKDSDGVFHFVRNGDKVVITALPPKEKQN